MKYIVASEFGLLLPQNQMNFILSFENTMSDPIFILSNIISQQLLLHLIDNPQIYNKYQSGLFKTNAALISLNEIEYPKRLVFKISLIF